jgi:putative transposase
MSRHSFAVDTRYQLNGTVYVIRQREANGILQVEDVHFGGHQTVTEEALLAAYGRHELRFERPPLPSRKPVPSRKQRQDAPRPEELCPDFTRVKEGLLRTETERRYTIMLKVLQMPPEERNRKGFEALSQTLEKAKPEMEPGARPDKSLGNSLSAFSIERWWKDFEASGYDERVLMPQIVRRGGKGKKRLRPEVEALFEELFVEYREHPAERTLQEVIDDLQEKLDKKKADGEIDPQVELPCDTTVYLRIQAAGATALTKARRSRSKAKQENPIQPGPKPEWIMQRVEIDHTWLPFLLVDDVDRMPIGFPLLTTVLDCYSEMPVGFFVGFEPPSLLADQNCLLHAILPKNNDEIRQMSGAQHPWITYGIPDVLVTDKGSDFQSSSFKDACAQLGIIVMELPGRSPWLKARIERFFRTTIKQLGAQIPGSIDKLTPLFDETYNPKKYACISLSSFIKILYLYLLDIYAQHWHKGIEDIPAVRWQRSVEAGHPPELSYSAKEVEDALRRSAGPRKNGPRGIEFEMLYYNSAELIALRKVQLNKAPRRTVPAEHTGDEQQESTEVDALDEWVEIKFDPGDLSAIYVWSPIHNGGNWIRVEAVDQEYTRGLTYWKHKLVRRYVTRQKWTVNSASLRRGKHEIQEIVNHEIQLGKQARNGRKNAARHNNIGIQPVPGTGRQAVVPQTVAASAATLGQTLPALRTPQQVTIGKAPPDAIVAADASSSPPTPTPAASTNKSRRSRKDQAVQSTPAPTPTPRQWNMTGWSADYEMPKPGFLTVIKK